MYRLVLDLLDLARFDSGIASLERVPVDLRELLNGVVAKFSPIAQQAQVEIGIEFDDIPSVLGDIDRLSQVFGNLIDNAVKHTPSGGQVSLHAYKEGGFVVVSIADTGPGIPFEDLERIFERFYQVDKSRPGSRSRGVGLGLSIAYEIVRAHGGSITVRNNIPQGSVFVVQIPAACQDVLSPR